MTKKEIENLDNAFILKVDESEKFAENMQELFEDFKKEAEESLKKLKNRIRRFKRSRSGFGLWGLYQQLTKEEKKLFIQECMVELHCSKVTVYNYLNRRKPLKDEVADKINNIFNKYGIN